MILRSKTINVDKLNAIVGAYGVGTIINDSKALSRGRFGGGQLISFRLRLTEPTPKDKSKTAQFQRRSPENHRVSAVCWHGHREVMKGIFAYDPEARLTTAAADYDTSEGFYRAFPATGNRNIGSMVQPMLYIDACDCGE